MRKVDPTLIGYLLEETEKKQPTSPFFTTKELVEDIRRTSESMDRIKPCFSAALLRSRVGEKVYKELTKDIPNAQYL